MADIQETIAVLSSLKIDVVGEDWVKEVWNQEFSDHDPLPSAYQEILDETNYHIDNLQEILSCLKSWVVSGHAASGEGFWTVLVENDLSHKGILAMLFYLVHISKTNMATATHIEAGILAANTYLNMIQIPGSGAFKIFHPMFYEKSLGVFRMWEKLGSPTGSKRKRSSSPIRQSQRSSQRSSQRTKKGRSKKQANQGASTESITEEDPFDDEEEEAEEEAEVLTVSEKVHLQKALIAAMRSLVFLLDNYSLKGTDRAVALSAETLAFLSRFETADTHENVFDSNKPVNQMKRVSQLAYKGLIFLSKVSHGAANKTMRTIFKSLQPSILMLVGKNKNGVLQSIPREIQNIRDLAVGFVCHLLQSETPHVISAASVLIQTMCSGVPDKAEYRPKVAQAIAEILRHFPSLDYAKMMQWMYKFSRNNKMGYRVFALDLVVVLIAEPERSLESVTDFPVAYLPYLSRSFLMQMILNRCSDAAATVRTRAVTVFAQCAESKEAPMQAAIRQLVTPAPTLRAPKSRIPASMLAADSLGAGQDSTGNAENRPVPVLVISDSSARSSVEGGESTGRPSVESVPGCSSSSSSTLVPTAGPSFSSENITPQTSTLSAEGRIPSAMMTVALTPGLGVTMADGLGVSSMLRRRCGDSKVNVRKSALLALENIIRLEGERYNPEDLAAITERCQDPALSVRKQAIQSLHALLEDLPRDETVQKAFLDGVVPMVLDRETTAQDKCLDTLEEVIFSKIVPAARSKTSQHHLAWSLLNIIAKDEEVELQMFIMKMCRIWGRQGKLKVGMISALQSHVGTCNNEGTWMFLSALALFAPKFNADFVCDYWQNTARAAPESEHNTVSRVLTVLGHVASYLDEDRVAAVAADLKEKLSEFNSPPELTCVTVATLAKLCQAHAADQQEAKRLTSQWFEDLLKSCDRYLSTVILRQEQSEELDVDKVIRHLFTLGEIAQICPQKTPKRVFMLVESLVAAPVISSVDWEDHGDTSTGSDGLSQPTQGTQATQVLSQFRGSKMSSKVRAHAFMTLGKLCLQYEKIAKQCVPAMARELEIADDFCVRNNVVIVLCDLCVRYTTMVERHIGSISACLKDSSVLIRRQTLTLITNLLQEDFLKWKDSLFFRFVSTIVDKDKNVKEFAEFCLVHLLKQRHPAMFFHHCIECVFHFNAYEADAKYNNFIQSDKEKQKFSLAKKENEEHRMYIYKFLLDNMTDEQKFQITARLCQEVLAAIVDEALPLNADSSEVLRDTLRILAAKEIKLSTMRSRPVDEAIETEQEMAQAVMIAAKKKLISAVMKMNVMENIVPTVTSLKHILEKKRSPLLKELMMYLQELMKDYKKEVSDILAADRQLAKEIEFDLRKFEEQQKAEEDARAIGQNSSRGNSPSRSPDGRRGPGTPTPPGTPGHLPRRGTPGRATPGCITPSRATPGRTTPGRTTPGRPTPGHSSPGHRSPGHGSPARASPGCLRALPPHMQPATKRGTPVRQISLEAIARLNSAKKAMEQGKQAREQQEEDANGLQPQRLKKVNWMDQKDSDSEIASTSNEISSEDSSGGSGARQFKTPKNKRVLRAISTPSTNLSMLNNITFQGDNLSMIVPPSPHGAHTPRQVASWGGEEEEEDKEAPVVVHIFSPDRPAPPPRQWNIQSPAQGKRRTSNRNKEN